MIWGRCPGFGTGGWRVANGDVVEKTEVGELGLVVQMSWDVMKVKVMYLIRLQNTGKMSFEPQSHNRKRLLMRYLDD